MGSPGVIASWKKATMAQNCLSTIGMPVYGSEYKPFPGSHWEVRADASPEAKICPKVNLKA